MLEALLRKEIQENGPLSQNRFMEMALQHPTYGYYRSQEGVGRDFTTAPEVSQMFGELIGTWSLNYYQNLGTPSSLMVVELGPGRGTLLADFLRVANRFPSFLGALTLHLVEINPLLKQAQEKAIHHPSLAWHERVEVIPCSSAPLIMIANEFFDVLPTQCYVRQDNMLYERAVGVKEDQLSFVLTPLHKDEGADQIWEKSSATEAAMKTICARLLKQGGVFLCFDYGYETGGGDSLQSLFEGGPSSVLSHVGYSDLTCHVNFGHLKEIALSEGLGVLGPLPQGQFLKNIGIDLRAELLKDKNPEDNASIESAVVRLTHPQQMGVLFKVMAVFSPLSPLPAGFEP